MGNYNSIVSNTSMETDMLQQVQNTCTTTDHVKIDNNYFVSGSNINIDAEITQNNFSCSIQNNFDESVINSIVNNMSQSASSESGLIWPFPTGLNQNSTDINNKIAVHMQQIMTNNCNSEKSVEFNDNFLNAKGNIDAKFIISGNTVSCAMTNVAKMTADNSASNTVAQIASITNAITTIVIAIVVGIVVYYSVKAYSGRGQATTVELEKDGLKQKLTGNDSDLFGRVFSSFSKPLDSVQKIIPQAKTVSSNGGYEGAGMLGV